METGKHVILLSLSLCLLSSYVSTKDENPYGEPWFKPKQDISASNQLQQLKRQQGQLERALAKTLPVSKKQELNWELQDVRSSIAQLEVKLNKKLVSHEEKLLTIEGLKKEFEMEKEELRKELDDVESKRLKAIANLKAQQKTKSPEVDTLQGRIDKLSQERDTIAKELAEFTEAYNQQVKILDQEKDKIITEREKVKKTLDPTEKRGTRRIRLLGFF